MGAKTGQRRYQANGFIPYNCSPGRVHLPADSDNIVKGDALFDDGNGYATNAITAMANTFLGIAAANCDNSGGSQGDLKVEVFPYDPTTRYIVPVAADALITQTAVGTFVDLENNDDIDISDTTIASGPGFFIEEIDVTTEAKAANAYGYAIGCFRFVS